jgi:hypothetical protein
LRGLVRPSLSDYDMHPSNLTATREAGVQIRCRGVKILQRTVRAMPRQRPRTSALLVQAKLAEFTCPTLAPDEQ